RGRATDPEQARRASASTGVLGPEERRPAADLPPLLGECQRPPQERRAGSAVHPGRWVDDPRPTEEQRGDSVLEPADGTATRSGVATPPPGSVLRGDRRRAEPAGAVRRLACPPVRSGERSSARRGHSGAGAQLP